MENTSGHGEYSYLPEEVKKWNWGAFWLTWIWGIFNKSYISLLSLLPILNVIMPFYLGMKGNELAWKNKSWYDVEDLHDTQRKWAIAGWIIGLLALSLIISDGIDGYKEHKEFKEVTAEVLGVLETNEEVVNFIGNNIEVVNTYKIEARGTQNSISTFIIRSTKGAFLIDAKLNDNNEVEEMEISEFGDGNEESLVISINK